MPSEFWTKDRSSGRPKKPLLSGNPVVRNIQATFLGVVIAVVLLVVWFGLIQAPDYNAPPSKGPGVCFDNKYAVYSDTIEQGC